MSPSPETCFQVSSVIAWSQSEFFFFLSILLLMSTFKIFVVCLENLSATSKLHWRQQLLMKAGILKKVDSYFLQAWRFPSVGERKVSHKWKSVKETPPTTSCWGKTRFDMMYSAVRGESERWESNRYVCADSWMENQVLALLHKANRRYEEQQEQQL